MLNYEFCKIGQLDRCKLSGCEWKKVFNGYCGHRPTVQEDYFKENRLKNERLLKQIEKQATGQKLFPIEKKKKEIFAIAKSDGIWDNIKTVKQDPWITKIKTV